MRRAFSLLELIVVVGIILIVISFASIGIPALIRNSSTEQSIRSIQMAAITASTLSEYYCTPVAMRFERVPKTDSSNNLVLQYGAPVFEDRQQIHLAVFAQKQSEPMEFGTTSIRLNGVGLNIPETKVFRRIPGYAFKLADSSWACPNDHVVDELWQSKNMYAAPLNPFDTFYVVYLRGAPHTMNEWLLFMDERQVNNDRPVVVDHPNPSHKKILVYDRMEYHNNRTWAIAKSRMMIAIKHEMIVNE